MSKTKTQMKTREVEYFRCWPGTSNDNGSWDTSFISVPADTPEDKLNEAINKAAQEIDWEHGEEPVFVGLYYADQECVDEDEEPGLQEGPLTLAFFKSLPRGTELTLHYWCFNKGDMKFKYDHVGPNEDALNLMRVYGQLWDDRQEPGEWTEVGDFLYEYAGIVCRGSGAEPVHLVPPTNPDRPL